MTTIFSKIVTGEIPADVVYEDDIVLAFLDNNPVQPGHTLVVPKVASKNALDCSPEIFAHIAKVAQKIAQAQIKVLGCDGVNLIMNNGEAAAQIVFHTHLHVIPRYMNDDCYGPMNHTKSDPSNHIDALTKLKAELAS